MQVKLIFGLVLALLVAIFALQNAQAVDINFLIFTIEQAALAGVLIAVLGIGVLFGVLISAPSSWGKGRRIKELENELKRKEDSTLHLTKQLQDARQELAAVYDSCAEAEEAGEDLPSEDGKVTAKV
jgi:lipopolysaccharide assembly protein A